MPTEKHIDFKLVGCSNLTELLEQLARICIEENVQDPYYFHNSNISEIQEAYRPRTGRNIVSGRMWLDRTESGKSGAVHVLTNRSTHEFVFVENNDEIIVEME